MTVKDRILQALNEVKEPVYTDKDAAELEAAIKSPFKKVKVSSLGGVGRESLMIQISLDPKGEWNNNIFQNSRYVNLAIHSTDGTINFGNSSHKIEGKKMRKAKFTDIKDAAAKINKYLASLS
jgi:hypothetical protein